MNSLPLKAFPSVMQGLLDSYHEKTRGKDKLVPVSMVWRRLDSTTLQAIIRAVNPGQGTAYLVASVAKFFSERDPDVALSYRWSALLGDIFNALSRVCQQDEFIWIDILFNGQNDHLTSQAVLELTPKRYQGANRHVLVVTEAQDLSVLLCRGWIAFEIAVRTKSDKPMVELVDPHRKAIKLFEQGGLGKNIFSSMHTFDPEDKTLIQEAIIELFSGTKTAQPGKSLPHGGASCTQSSLVEGFVHNAQAMILNLLSSTNTEKRCNDAASNFNRTVDDFVRLAGGKMLLSSLDRNQEWKGVLRIGWDLAQEMHPKGKYKDCVFIGKCLRRAAERTHGQEHLDVARSNATLGMGLAGLGDLSAARHTYQEALRVYTAVLGEDHEQLSFTRRGLADIYAQQGCLAEALAANAKAFRALVRCVGECHPDVALIRVSVARIYQDQGRLEEALSEYSKALRISQTCFGVDHAVVARIRKGIANVYFDQGKLREAQAECSEALQLCRTSFGSEHPQVGATLFLLGCVLHSTGHVRQAHESFHEAKRILLAALGSGHENARLAKKACVICGEEERVAHFAGSQAAFAESKQRLQDVRNAVRRTPLEKDFVTD